jgi:hypothetical protein
MAETDTHAKIEETLKGVFSVRYVPRPCNQSQLTLEEFSNGSDDSRRMV